MDKEQLCYKFFTKEMPSWHDTTVYTSLLAKPIVSPDLLSGQERTPTIETRMGTFY